MPSCFLQCTDQSHLDACIHSPAKVYIAIRSQLQLAINYTGTEAFHVENDGAVTSDQIPEDSTPTEVFTSSDTVLHPRPEIGCGCGECTIQTVQNCPKPIKEESVTKLSCENEKYDISLEVSHQTYSMPP